MLRAEAQVKSNSSCVTILSSTFTKFLNHIVHLNSTRFYVSPFPLKGGK